MVCVGVGEGEKGGEEEVVGDEVEVAEAMEKGILCLEMYSLPGEVRKMYHSKETNGLTRSEHRRFLSRQIGAPST